MMDGFTKEELQGFVDAGRILTKYAPWIKWLVVGAFALGGWVAILNYRLDIIEAELRTRRVWMEDQSRSTSETKVMIQALQESVNEIKADVKSISRSSQ